MVDIPVQNMDQETLRHLVDGAKARGVSVSEMAIEIIRAALDAEERTKRVQNKRDRQ